MTDAECVEFLQWALPRIDLRWQGLRKVRRQVCKRLRRRLQVLELDSLRDYQRYLESNPEEWRTLEASCRITISRFFRDRGVYRFLQRTALPALAETALATGRSRLDAWSAGCASGEEPYSLALLWVLALAAQYPGVELHVIATDVDPVLIERARRARYPSGSLKELPTGWRVSAFETVNGEHRLRAAYRDVVELRAENIRTTMPDGPFDLILCRNLVFTYFSEQRQVELMGELVERLSPCGALVIGAHENLPAPCPMLMPWSVSRGVYRHRPP